MKRKTAHWGRFSFRLPANAPSRSTCIEMVDFGVTRFDATSLIRGAQPRDVAGSSARLAEQFLHQNAGVLGSLGVSSSVSYDGSNVAVIFRSSNKVGAVPLISPTSGRIDFGLVINPRFGWTGIGPMMAQTGWRIVPSILKLPLLPRSARSIPAWVISAVILLRVQELLKQLSRRFELVEEELQAPRGAVLWPSYALKQIPRAKFLNIACRFPDLRDDRQLKSAIHFVLRKQLASLESQKHVGVVQALLILCHNLLRQVQASPAHPPQMSTIRQWLSHPMRREAFRDGLQAIEWTIEDRGLAGLSDFQGLPWLMSMEAYFEALAETLMEQVARQIGGTVKVGRKRETVKPIAWEPPYTGSQRFLLPDVVLSKENETVVVDAKYKVHWEELRTETWYNIEDQLREHHRADLLQVLAYSTTFSTSKITACLLYPCRLSTWESMVANDRTFHKASIPAGNRQISLILTAVPLEGKMDESVRNLASILKSN